MATCMCLFLVTMLSLLTLSTASFFHVGGSDGWSSSKNVNYTQWSNSIHFQVDDVLVFEYDNKTENVIRVNPHSFKTCNMTSPVHQWSSGNDQVRLPRTGHFYFVSSLDGKCEGKARLSVQVYENGHDDDDDDDDDNKPPSPVTPATPDGATPAAAPAPHHSDGTVVRCSGLSIGLGLVMMMFWIV